MNPTSFAALSRLSPKRSWMAAVTGASLRHDAFAGLTNAAVVLPQGVAFAVIAGLPPQYGLFTAMITPVVAAIWGSSMVMVSGPTTAISAVIFATLANFADPGTPGYVTLALTLTVLVGAFQLAAGLLHFGALISFISHSVMIGFTAAAALLIAASQLGDFLGISVEGGGGIVQRFATVAENFEQLNVLALVISAMTFLSVLAIQWCWPRLPAYLIALAGGAALGGLLDAPAHGIEMFAPLPAIVPYFHAPSFPPAILAELAPGAAAIAFVGLLEAISIGRSFAMRRGERYDSNQEIVGQGLSNVVGGFFQAYAGSGSFTRSALNAQSGARTPISAIFAAGFLLMMLLLISPYVDLIPVPAMAGIIVYVAWRLVDLREIRHVIASSQSETAILATTFLVGVLAQLDVAIVAGVIASLVVFLRQSAQPFIAVVAPAIYHSHRSFRNAHMYDLDQCPEISVLRMEGPLFFGSVEHVEREFRRLERLDSHQRIKVFVLKGVGRLDLSGADFLIHEILTARKKGGDFHIVAQYPLLIRALKSMHVLDVLGSNNLHISKVQAIAAAVSQARDEVCAKCKIRAFSECGQKPRPEGVPPTCPVKDISRSRSTLN